MPKIEIYLRDELYSFLLKEITRANLTKSAYIRRLVLEKYKEAMSHARDKI